MRMQYGGQQGYDSGYGAQQGYQDYGAQQSFLADKVAQQNYNSNGVPVSWRIEPFYGVQAMPQYRFPALPKYAYLPYTVRNGEDQVLSRWNMMQEESHVSRVQCMVKVLPDGTPTLIGCGKFPSLYRTPGGAWSALYKGQTVLLADGMQVSLDYEQPENAVFTCYDESAMQQGGYQQQGLPAGWTTGIDQSSGQTYYFNEQTGQSQWEPPQQGGYY